MPGKLRPSKRFNDKLYHLDGPKRTTNFYVSKKQAQDRAKRLRQDGWWAIVSPIRFAGMGKRKFYYRVYKRHKG